MNNQFGEFVTWKTGHRLLPLEHDVYIRRVTEWLEKLEIHSLLQPAAIRDLLLPKNLVRSRLNLLEQDLPA